MLLQSNNHVYVYNHKSKYLLPLHPLVTHFITEEKQGKDIDLKKIEKELAKDYSKDEINLLYHQYLFFKEHSFFETNIEQSYGTIRSESIIESFNSVQHIVFEVTESCNLQCVYCAYGDYYINRGERRAKNMNFTLARNLLLHFVPVWKSEAERSKDKQISIGFYGGEPLLNYELISQIIDFCESLGFRNDFFRFSMTTNGILIKKYQEFLINKKIHITVSLDGNKENNSYRILKNGENSFDEIIDNVNSIKEIDREYFESNVGFIGVVHDRTSMEQAFVFCKERFNKMPSLSPLSTDNVAPQKKEQFDKMYKEIVSDVSPDFLLSLSDDEWGKYDIVSYLRKNCQHLFKHFIDVYQIKKNTCILPTGTCIPFSRRIFLSTEGKILPCERISINHCLGNVDENKGVDLNFETIAEYFNNTISKYKNDCKNCYSKNSCGFCALKCSENRCNEFMTNEKFVENMVFYLTLLEKYPHLYNYSKTIIQG